MGPGLPPVLLSWVVFPITCGFFWWIVFQPRHSICPCRVKGVGLGCEGGVVLLERQACGGSPVRLEGTSSVLALGRKGWLGHLQ